MSLKRLVKRINEDRIFGCAAQLSYYFLLALFPLLLFLINILGYVALAILILAALAIVLYGGTIGEALAARLRRERSPVLACGWWCRLVSGSTWDSSILTV